MASRNIYTARSVPSRFSQGGARGFAGDEQMPQIGQPCSLMAPLPKGYICLDADGDGIGQVTTVKASKEGFGAAALLFGTLFIGGAILAGLKSDWGR